MCRLFTLISILSWAQTCAHNLNRALNAFTKSSTWLTSLHFLGLSSSVTSSRKPFLITPHSSKLPAWLRSPLLGGHISYAYLHHLYSPKGVKTICFMVVPPLYRDLWGWRSLLIFVSHYKSQESWDLKLPHYMTPIIHLSPRWKSLHLLGFPPTTGPLSFGNNTLISMPTQILNHEKTMCGVYSSCLWPSKDKVRDNIW